MGRRPLLVRAVLRPRPLPTASRRTFAHRTPPLGSGRPSVPFLALPSSLQLQLRRLSTERGRRLRYSLLLWTKYAVFVAIGCGCAAAARFALRHEGLERDFPTPPEWSYLARCALRDALGERARRDVPRPDYVKVVQLLRYVLARLEDPAVDGPGLTGLGPDAHGAFDISGKSEPWRRGYFEVLLALAGAAEQVDGWVLDKTRGIVFEPDLVVGPSNPHRRPIPPGSATPPREENCEPFCPPPENFYLKLQHTAGLAAGQLREATVGLALWEEFRGDGDAAEAHFRAAVTALMGPGWDADFARRLDDWARAPHPDAPASVLDLLTDYATFRARNFEAAAALPLFVNLLRTRRALAPPPPEDAPDPRPPTWREQAATAVRGAFTPPAYPPPPSDGADPPRRDARGRCEEAALAMHIGEIVFASDTKARDGAVAWARDAVDAAEEQLRALDKAAPAAPKCRECLAAGLDTWAAMARVLARDEEQRRGERPADAPAAWWALWGGAARPAGDGRWGAEEKLIAQRRARARDLLEEPPPPGSFWDPITQFWNLTLT